MIKIKGSPFKGEGRLLIAPYNQPGVHLGHMLTQQYPGLNCVGYLDNKKTGEEILSDIPPSDQYDWVLVAPSSFQLEIRQGLLARGVPDNRIIYARAQSGSAMQLDEIHLSKRPYRGHHLSVYRKAFKWLSQLAFRVAKRVSSQHQVAFFAKEFLDSNLLELLLAQTPEQQSRSSLLLWEVSYIPEELQEKFGGRIVRNRLKIHAELLRCHSVVMDHYYNTNIFIDQAYQHLRIYQIWHGLPVKKIYERTHVTERTYYCFVSHSNWYNESVFNKVFCAKSFCDWGAPRNDNFLLPEEQRCFIGSVPYSALQNYKANRKRIIFYMPTYRDHQDNDYPIDLSAISKLCAINNCLFIMKLHPFLMKRYVSRFNQEKSNEEGLIDVPEFENVKLFPAHLNPYPWLASTDILISDYSSVHLDFLLADKPILFYWYDFDNYTSARGRFIVDIQSHCPGDKAYSMKELLTTLEHNLTTDNWAASRQNLCESLQLTQELCSQRLANKLHQSRS